MTVNLWVTTCNSEGNTLLPLEKQSVSTKVTNVKHAYMHDEIY